MLRNTAAPSPATVRPRPHLRYRHSVAHKNPIHTYSIPSYNPSRIPSRNTSTSTTYPAISTSLSSTILFNRGLLHPESTSGVRCYSTSSTSTSTSTTSPETSIDSPQLSNTSTTSTSSITSTTTDSDASRENEKFDLEQFTQELNRSGDTFGEGEMEAPPDVGDVGMLGRIWEAISPVEHISTAMEQVHSMTGMPWWSLIVLSCFAMRVALSPIQIAVTRNSFRMQKLQPVLKAVRERHMNSMRSKGASGNQAMQEEVRGVMKQYNVSPFKSILVGLTQMPVFILFFVTLRHMAATVDSFRDGGLAWFQDLSMHDPYGVLPILSAALMMGSGELMQYYQKVDHPDMKPPHWAFKWIIRSFMLLGPVITFKMPAAIFVYWVANGFFNSLQTLILRIPAVRRAFRITDRDIAAELNKHQTGGGSLSPSHASTTNSSSQDSQGKPKLYTHRPNKQRR